MLEITTVLANGPGVIHPALLWDEGDAILVDAGFPGQLGQFRAAVEGAGVPWSRLGMAIVTHSDMDISAVWPAWSRTPRSCVISPYAKCALQWFHPVFRAGCRILCYHFQ